MSKIPTDAALWDSGDWIAWHRQPQPLQAHPCTAASQDMEARQRSVMAAMLHAAQSYNKLTGRHLAIYDQLAEIYADISFDLATQRLQTKVVCIPPHAGTDIVSIALDVCFECLVVVRIAPDFKMDARSVQREALPDCSDQPFALRWSDLQAP